MFHRDLLRTGEEFLQSPYFRLEVLSSAPARGISWSMLSASSAATVSLLWIAPAWILLAVATLLLVRPLLLAARRADELEVEEPARFEVQLALVEVERHWRSRGRRFFESGEAWLQLTDDLVELGVTPASPVPEARSQAA